MCGLSGVAGEIVKKDDCFMLDSLVFNIVRGEDSTGIGFVPKKDIKSSKDLFTIKALGPSTNVLSSKHVGKAFMGSNKVVLGHNRAATLGSVNVANAHPFIFSNTIGMHNGTVSISSKNRLPDASEFDTDSEAIFNSINTLGPEETISKLDENGAWALVWYNISENSLNFIRNENRPLFYVMAESQKSLYFSSEFDLMMAALRRNGIKFAKPYVLPENTLLTWTVPAWTQAFEKPRRKKIKGRPFKSVTSYVPSTTWNSNSAFSKSRQQAKIVKDSGMPTSNGRSVWSPTEGRFVPVDTKGDRVPEEIGSSVVLPRKEEGPLGGTVLKDGVFKGFRPFLSKDMHFVGFDPQRHIWVEGWKQTHNGAWHRCEMKFAPESLPYRKLDFCGNHKFQHVGKKKRKKVFYKGYKDNLMSQSHFEAAMSVGCISCNRIPEWGNEVMFINEEDHFLCQYCMLDSSLVKAWQDVAA